MFDMLQKVLFVLLDNLGISIFKEKVFIFCLR
jgi:hypothetical protein